ncbi:hypothetical protein E4U42_002743 [Claviceps africana]|uniref:Secondary alcohol dehydrogenase n=1 Tax=Claviceps africana TaxID=83212 RepID=A0A8K0NLR3_9HYPO|nr:hypothetical protein E4U42_002743 [Claviceps africana]
MSADTRPISPSRFAAALKDLSLSMLHLKVLEIRNSLAHLQYSNDQLRPFAEGTATVLGGNANPQPDQDCVEAMRENDAVMGRMAERIALVRAEVEARGISWAEFRSEDDVARARAQSPRGNGRGARSPEDAEGLHSAWTDGTFQTGTIRNGEMRLASQRSSGADGGGRSDDELRRAVEERMRDLDDNGEDGGVHL